MSEQTCNRRAILAAAVAAVGSLAVRPTLRLSAADADVPVTKTVLIALYKSLTPQQRTSICFDWDTKGYGNVPRRLHVSNSWQISGPKIGSSFYNDEQQQLIAEALSSVMSPGWPAKLARQVEEDGRGKWGQGQSIGIFGTPAEGRMQLTLTGFHLTIKAEFGDDSPVAFGGSIAHGHQPSGFNEKVGHPENIFWYQALAANKAYDLLDDQQRQNALVSRGMPYYEFDGKIDRSYCLPDTKYERPREHDVRFRTEDMIPGLPIAKMSSEQKQAVDRTLHAILEPYRKSYRDQVLDCLKSQGGLRRCKLAFYKERDLGNDSQWDNWRLEGPTFICYWRGFPHVHIWLHVANTPNAKVSSNFG
jgi:hypothetical protein